MKLCWNQFEAKMNVEIEPTQDYKQLAKLNESVQTWHHQHYPEDFKPFSLPEIEQAFKKMMRDQNFFAFIAKRDKELIGYLLGFYTTRPESAFQLTKSILCIDQIAVSPQHRNHGVGQLLMDAALKLADQHEIQEIQLEHWSSNQGAEDFFSKNGFVYFKHRMRK